MERFYDFVGRNIVGNRYHIVCDCFVGIDIKGLCTGYEINKGELILLIDIDGKTIPVGANTPNLKIEKI